MEGQHELHGNFKAVGGALCLDFTNTASARDTGSLNERLHTYEDLLTWGEVVDALPKEGIEALRREAAQRPAEAEEALRQALHLRETLFRIFLRVIEGAAPEPADLTYLNEAVAATYSHLCLEPGAPHYTWKWDESPGRLDRILWPVVHSAAELLTGGELERVRICDGERCGWLFIDRSKNHSRRWCDMRDCGNVAKVRRYRRKRKMEASV